jgi:hypothetical protein
MAQRTARDRRAEGRKERRAKTSQAPAADGRPEDVADDSTPVDALRAAATAAIAGAAIGAARAFAHRDAAEEELETEEPPQEPEALGESEAVEPAPESESEPAPKPEEESEEEPEADAEPLPPGDVRGLVARARDQLRDLRGVEAESVSSIRPTANGWRIGLEVVELHRIPESTDVLATYEVELDRDGALITFERAGRYHRSEADRR